MRSLFLVAAVLLTATPDSWSFVPVKLKPQMLERSYLNVPRMGEKLHRVSTKMVAFHQLADHVEIDSISGVVRLIEGNIKSAPVVKSLNKSDFIVEIEKFIRQHKDIFKVSISDLKLVEEESSITDTYQHFKFDVFFNGIRCKDSQVDFRFRKGKLFQVLNETFGEATIAKSVISKAEAEEIAKNALDKNAKQIEKKVLRVSPTADGYELVPVLKYQFHSVMGPFNAEIDLHNFNIREITPRHFHGRAMIKGFSRTYMSEPSYAPYANGIIYNDMNEKVTTGAEGEIPDGQYFFRELSGATAEVISKDRTVALDAMAIKANRNSGAQYIINPWQNLSPDDTWAAYGSVYTNVATIKSLIKETLGESVNDWMDRPTKAYVNHNAQCNAYWNGKSINFYQGSSECANSGNLGDIVLHEWAHGLDYNSGGITDGAYSEGFGDLIAFSVYLNPKIGETFYKKDAQKPVRDISIFKSYPKDATGGVHAEGQIISNTMYELYTTLNKLKHPDEALRLFRGYLYSMIRSTRKYTEVHNFIQSIEPDPVTSCVVNQVFVKHGLAKVRGRCQA